MSRMQGFEPVTFYQANPDHLDTDPPEKWFGTSNKNNNASNDIIQELERHIVKDVE